MQKNCSVSPLFGRVISTFMKHINCIQIKYVFVNIKMGEVFLSFFFFSLFKTSSQIFGTA